MAVAATVDFSYEPAVSRKPLCGVKACNSRKKQQISETGM